MRHLESLEVDSATEDVYKRHDKYLENLEEIKEEIPNLILDDRFIKDEFSSDEESLLGTGIKLEIENDSSSDESDSQLKNGIRRNRRKATSPQKAVQLEISQSGSLGNSSESSQDITDKFNYVPELSSDISNILMSDSENGLDLTETDELLQEINEDDIFKDLQEEAIEDGEKLDEKMMDNVKEEWRAHWGVKCNMCEQVFSFKAEFDKHYIMSYSLHPVYTCTFCNKSAEKYSTFRSHCYRHITEGRYKCQECPKGFSLQSLLHVHILSKHTKAKPFKCDECGKSFVTKPGLNIHLRKHKTELKEDYPCVECGKILHTRGGLTSHMNVHRLGRRFMCDVCGKTFTQKVNMQQHVKQHTGDKPYACDKCGKTFTEKSHLARHYSFHSNVRPFKCEVCQKMYKTERCLKVHSLVHASERPYVCTYCKKGFLSSTKLKQHYNIHTGERPYKCKYCERTFTNYPNWLKHTRRRHKVDHKTGEELEKPKSDLQIASPSVSNEVVPDTETTDTCNDQILTEISLTKTEELLLQQNFLNLPLLDDKMSFSQQIEMPNSGSGNLLGNYYHQAIIQPSTTNASMQFNDLPPMDKLHETPILF